MADTATQLNSDATIETAVVTSVDPLTVSTTAGSYRAKRAKSCLVAAAKGDCVLVATLSTGHAFVLAVLESPDANTTLSFDGPVQLEAERVGINGRRAVSLKSGGQLDMMASAVKLRAITGEVAVEKLTLLSRYAQAELGKAKVFGESLDGTFERVSQKAKNVYRIVTGSDHLRATMIDHSARRLLKLFGKNAIMTAEDLVKVDGKQIHMG
jgi:hypothetical protein